MGLRGLKKNVHSFLCDACIYSEKHSGICKLPVLIFVVSIGLAVIYKNVIFTL